MTFFIAIARRIVAAPGRVVKTARGGIICCLTRGKRRRKSFMQKSAIIKKTAAEFTGACVPVCERRGAGLCPSD
ncbi:MAG: hypothetical protein OXF52_04145 [Candidatus Dadabacteria bacterium]|nr:hypothetical protein [Candidatus Dadabacteria bacterium]